MANPSTSTTVAADASQQSTEFETRRAGLVHQIGDSLEQVLTQINALNRSLEGIIEIGNEFASVEALWSQFESVMGTNADTFNNDTATQDDETQGDQHGGSRDSHSQT